jgi:hypothetical protein
MDASQIQKIPLSPEEHQKALEDVHFISEFSVLARSLGYRVIISGVYAVDGALGVITRPHDDIDMQIYGQDDAAAALHKLFQKYDPSLLQSLTDQGRKEFWHLYHLQLPHTLVEIYYLQVTTDPFTHEKIIIKADGANTPSHPYHTRTSRFQGHAYEIQHPRIELADRVYKRTIRKDEAKTKHDLDMANLLLITDPKEVEGELEMMKARSS